MYDPRDQVDLSFKKRTSLTGIGLACFPLGVGEVNSLKSELRRTKLQKTYFSLKGYF